MNITWNDIQNMNHDQLCYEWAKYQWLAEEESKAIKNIKTN